MRERRKIVSFARLLALGLRKGEDALRLLTVAPAQRAKGFADGAVFLTVMHCHEDISLMIAERGGKVGGEIGRAESSEQALRESATAAARSSAVTSKICTSVDHASEIDGELRVPCLRAPSDWCLKARTCRAPPIRRARQRPALSRCSKDRDGWCAKASLAAHRYVDRPTTAQQAAGAALHSIRET
jgi:hypothetical protein